MATWFKNKKDEELPERLRGKTPEQVEADLQAAEDARTAAETARAAKETEATNAINEVNSLKQRLQALEGNRQPEKREPETPGEIPSVVVDEDGAFAARMAPTNAVALHAGTIAAKLAAKDAISSLGKDATERRMNQRLYDKYKAEVAEVVKTQHPSQQILEQTWVNAFVYVKGQHTADIMKSMSDGEDFFSEGSSSSGKLEDTSGANKDKLTDQEKLIAKKTGLTEDQYLKQKQSINYVGA